MVKEPLKHGMMKLSTPQGTAGQYMTQSLLNLRKWHKSLSPMPQSLSSMPQTHPFPRPQTQQAVNSFPSP